MLRDLCFMKECDVNKFKQEDIINIELIKLTGCGKLTFVEYKGMSY